jgi:hypothetical protein
VLVLKFVPSRIFAAVGLATMELGTTGSVTVVPTVLLEVVIGTSEVELVLATYTDVEVVPVVVTW